MYIYTKYRPWGFSPVLFFSKYLSFFFFFSTRSYEAFLNRGKKKTPKKNVVFVAHLFNSVSMLRVSESSHGNGKYTFWGPKHFLKKKFETHLDQVSFSSAWQLYAELCACMALETPATMEVRTLHGGTFFSRHDFRMTGGGSSLTQKRRKQPIFFVLFCFVWGWFSLCTS